MIDCKVRDPKWHNREHTMIELQVDWCGYVPHLKGEHPFVAWQEDHYEHGRELFERAAAGEFGKIAEWGTSS
jgi:hypothetical protein